MRARSGSNPASATVDKWLNLMCHGKKPRGQVVAQANRAKATVFKSEHLRSCTRKSLRAALTTQSGQEMNAMKNRTFDVCRLLSFAKYVASYPYVLSHISAALRSRTKSRKTCYLGANLRRLYWPASHETRSINVLNVWSNLSMLPPNKRTLSETHPPVRSKMDVFPRYTYYIYTPYYMPCSSCLTLSRSTSPSQGGFESRKHFETRGHFASLSFNLGKSFTLPRRRG